MPQALEPSTAISTFVIDEAKCELLGVSNEGVEVNLSALDKEIHSKLAHGFIEKFGFKLKKLMPFMVFQIALDDEFKHLCFIDTPGINAPDKGFTSNDEKNAKEFLDDADALIWVVRLKSGGISDDDLKFLNGLDLSQKKLFIVLNRADDLSPQEHKNIIELTAETLDNHCIEFEGISAYNSLERKEYLFEKMSLKEFLRTFEPKQNLQKKFLTQLNELFQAYQTAILAKSEKRKEIQKELHSFNLDLIEMKLDNKASIEKLNKIKRYFDDKKEDSSKTLEKIINQMKDAINAIFGKHLDMPLPNVSINNQKTPKAKNSSNKSKLNAMVSRFCKKKLGEKEMIEELEYIANECGVSVQEVAKIYKAKIEELKIEEMESTTKATNSARESNDSSLNIFFRSKK